MDPSQVEDGFGIISDKRGGMFKNKYLIIGVVITAVVIYAFSCGKKEAPKPKDAQKAQTSGSGNASDSVKQKVLSFNLEGLSDKGEKKWDVKGESAEAVSATQIKLDNIVAKSYGEDSQATIVADKGIYDKSKNNVMLEQNVKATIENMQEFAGNFSTIPGSQASSATAKETNQEKSKKTKTVITCDGDVLFDYENNHAYFTKNVKVVNDEGSIDSDKITVNLDPVTKKIKDIVADGNVKITRGEDITYSEKATYIDSDKRVILTGKPKIVIYKEGSLQDNFLSSK